MRVTDVYNIKKEKVKEVELPDEVFGVEVSEPVLHQVVTMQLARRRFGNASTKTRSEVRGGGRKPWRQKGTGRARAGTSRSPVWRHGGTVFGPKPRDYMYAVPKKVRRLALKMALSTRLQEEKLLLLDDFPMDEIKTKYFAGVIKTLGLNDGLILINGGYERLQLSARNVPKFKVLSVDGLNVYDILKYKNLVILEGCIGKIVERLLPDERHS